MEGEEGREGVGEGGKARRPRSSSPFSRAVAMVVVVVEEEE